MFTIFPKDDPKQTLRIKRFSMAFGSYLMWMAITFVLYSQGQMHRMTFNVLMVSFLAILVCNFLIYAIIRSGFNMRFKDPSLTLLQMIIATCWVMEIVYYADAIRSVVLLAYLVVFVFGLFKLSVRQFLFLSVFAVVTYAALIFLLHKTHPESLNNKVDILNILILTTVLPWFSLVGGYITRLRDKISDALSTIAQLTDNIRDVIFVLDMNLNYTYVSPSVKTLRGYEPEEIMKQAASDAFTPSSRDQVMKAWHNALALEKSGHIISSSEMHELEVKRKDGTTLWTETKFSLMKDEPRRSVGILAVMRDITERKEAEETLRQSEGKYRSILENTQEGYFEIDLAGNFTFFNDPMCRLYGYSKEEMMGVNNRQYTDEENAKIIFKTFNHIYQTGEPIKESSWQIIRKDGIKKYIESSASLIKDSENNPVGFRGIVRDITERKQMEEDLQRTLESLRKSVGATIQVMISAVEIRDPYTAGHQTRSADLARSIAREMDLPQEKSDGIRMAGFIHDIGKLSVPAEILSKTTKLSDIEFALVKEHALLGYEMLKNVESPWPLAQVAYQHHERMDGSGYPRKLKGDEIIIEARIMAVADVVEAMASYRPYRPALGINAALEEIEKNKGILYDRAVVDACLRLFREKAYALP